MNKAGDPLVAVIIVNWNGREVTLDCLASMRSVTYPNFRTILVDNGSTDGSADTVRQQYSDVILLETGSNLRFSGGTNAGIRHALSIGAEYFLLLNNDTTVDAGFLLNLVSRILLDAQAGMVAPKILYHSNPGRIWYAGGMIHMWTGSIVHRGIREQDRGQYNTSAETDFASGCCVLVSRAVVDRIGLLDETYTMYAEDVDWSLRARGAGFRIYYEPHATILHKVSVSAGGHLSWFKLRHKFASSMKFFARHAKWYHWFTWPWMSVLLNVLRGAGLVLQGKRS